MDKFARLRLVEPRARCPPLRDQVDAALAAAAHSRLGRAASTEQRAYLDDFWDARRRRDRRRRRAPAGGALRALPHAAGRRPRRAAGDPGQGPDRPRLRRPHVLGHRDVRAAGAHLHRARTRPPTRCAGATRRSTSRASAPQQLGLEGAAFPWRTIRGQECSGYWPAGTAAFHINADIADAVVRYVAGHRRRRVRARASGSSCSSRRRGCGARSATTTPTARFRIDGVTGPDEYTRARRQQRLHEPDGAAEPARGGRVVRPPPATGATRSASTTRRSASWRDAADAMRDPLRRRARRAPAGRGLHAPRGAGTSSARRPTSTRCCCTSRTSTSTASRSSSRPTSCWRMHFRGDAFTPEQKARNFAYYEAITVRDSSLSACTQAVSRPRSATSSSPTTTSPRRR